MAAASALVGALAVAVLPEGSVLRILLVLPVLLVVPGYLLLQVALAARGGPRGWHVALAVGPSIALVGLAALVTALLPGGFHARGIVAAVTAASLGLGFWAWRRRVAVSQRRRVATPSAPVASSSRGGETAWDHR